MVSSGSQETIIKFDKLTQQDKINLLSLVKSALTKLNIEFKNIADSMNDASSVDLSFKTVKSRTNDSILYEEVTLFFSKPQTHNSEDFESNKVYYTSFPDNQVILYITFYMARNVEGISPHDSRYINYGEVKYPLIPHMGKTLAQPNSANCLNDRWKYRVIYCFAPPTTSSKERLPEWELKETV